MLRALLMLTGIFSTVVLLAELSAVGLLWSRGYLTPQTVRDVRLALSGQTIAEVEVGEEVTEKKTTSEAEIREARVERVLELEARENELSLLKRMATDTANRLISDRQEFDQLKEEFRAELKQLKEQTVTAATEQTRAVLLASPPEDAVKRLMALTLPEGVDLLRGLPEKSIAKILLAFQQNAQTAERGQELFQALYRGDPNRKVIEDAIQQLTKNAGEVTPPE